MKFRDSPEQAAFRAGVRAVIDEAWPELLRRRRFISAGGALGAATLPGLVDDAYRQGRTALHAAIAARGWTAPSWPATYGGAGLSVMEQFILGYELASARAPAPGGIGVAYVGPTLIQHGSDDQRRAHLPPILTGTRAWCQLFSEPSAGSDLASLQTRAVRDGDVYVISGQKIWSSNAHTADWAILLARTDPAAPKHRGISYFLLDMRLPGISVRPLVNMAGTHEFNEVFLDAVRVPVHCRVGEEHRGWYVATSTLDYERSSIGSAVGEGQMVRDLVDTARELESGRPGTVARARLALAARAVEAQVALMLSYRIVSMQARGVAPNAEASLAKLFTRELDQRIAATALTVLGPYGTLDHGSCHVPYGGFFSYYYRRASAYTVGGGTSEVQRNIIAQRGLGMPRD